MAIRMKWYPTPQGYFGQLQGILAWDAYSRIAQIKSPTLIIHGETDQLVPAANSHLIAERIPHAKLDPDPRASHIFETDQPGMANGAIMEFLSAQQNSAHHSEFQPMNIYGFTPRIELMRDASEIPSVVRRLCPPAC